MIAFNPQDAEAHNNRGNTYAQLQRYEQALADLNQALTLNPYYTDAYYNRGLIYYQLGKISQTKKDWEKAASLFRQQNNIQLYEFIQQRLQNLSD